MMSCEHVCASGKNNNPFVRDVEPLPVADGPEF